MPEEMDICANFKAQYIHNPSPITVGLCITCPLMSRVTILGHGRTTLTS